MSLAKGLASERARQVLEDPESEYHLSKICDCNEAMAIDEPVQEATVDVDTTERKLDDETAEGFAALAQLAVNEAESDIDGVPIPDEDSERDEEEVITPLTESNCEEEHEQDINGHLKFVQDGLATMQCEIL